MTRPVLSVIGAGKAGGSIAKALLSSGVVAPGQVLNRTAGSTNAAAGRLGARPAVADALEPADLWLVGVPDDQLEATARGLDGQTAAIRGLCFHLSGACGPDVLAPLGTERAVFHPVRPFPAWLTPAELAGTAVGIVGSAASARTLRTLARAASLHAFEVPTGQQARYHAACSMASNFVVAIAAEAQRLFEEAGLRPETAHTLTSQLASRAAADVSTRGPGSALTGPIARGDRHTVARQLAAIDDHGTALYRQLVAATITLARRSGHLDADGAEALRALLGSERSRESAESD